VHHRRCTSSRATCCRAHTRNTSARGAHARKQAHECKNARKHTHTRTHTRARTHTLTHSLTHTWPFRCTSSSPFSLWRMSARVGAGTAVGQSDLPDVATRCTARGATQHNMLQRGCNTLQRSAAQHQRSRSSLALGSRECEFRRRRKDAAGTHARMRSAGAACEERRGQA
jgi:hypothetical protein